MYDDGLFFFHDSSSKLVGLMSCHVDHILWCLTDVLKPKVIDKLDEVFIIVALRYVGLDMKQNNMDRSITISQDSY